MVNASLANNQGGDGQKTADNRKVAAVVPFIRASQELREPMLDLTRTLTGSDQDTGVHDVPARGYLRGIVLKVEGTNASGSGVVVANDFPFNVLKGITFQEPNGAVIAQFTDGYQLMVSNKYGGYRAFADPRQSLTYSDDSSGNFQFTVRIPVELSERDGLGSLPNQNSAANFKLRVSLAKASDLYDTAPGTLPDVNVKAHIESWDQPPPSAAGAMNQTVPPAVNTTQYWSEQSYNVNSGEQGIRLSRMGNYLRNLVFIFRDADGNRVDSWPDPLHIYWDALPLDNIGNSTWDEQIYSRYGYHGDADSAGGPDLGVFPYDFCHEFDGKVGFENRDLWLPTLGSTRFEVQGNFPTAGTLYVLTNDVSVAGTVFM